VRQFLWAQSLPKTTLNDETLTAMFDGSMLITCDRDTSLKIDLLPGPKPIGYRLGLNGELLAESRLKVRRAQASGPYLAEEKIDQTDLLLLLTAPTAPLAGFPLTYLTDLLTAQVQTLSRGASLAEKLGQMLRPAKEPLKTTAPPPPVHTLDSLAEARRGLREADAALRKAMTSMTGLELGVATILDKEHPVTVPPPATVTIMLTPEIFEGLAREILIEVGATCTELAFQLRSAAGRLQPTLDAPAGFTVELYQQSYATAVDAAVAARQPLLEIITRLRFGIGSEQFPLVFWRVHNQVQEIAETLRWGVLRR
jgi:hypothetical protein